MDIGLKEIVQYIIQGGVAIVVFIIWYFTFTKASKQMDTALVESRKQSAAAFDKHMELNSQLIQLLKDEQEYKTTLTGVLDRISLRLETPAQCPILIAGRKFKFEVKE